MSYWNTFSENIKRHQNIKQLHDLLIRIQNKQAKISLEFIRQGLSKDETSQRKISQADSKLINQLQGNSLDLSYEDQKDKKDSTVNLHQNTLIAQQTIQLPKQQQQQQNKEQQQQFENLKIGDIIYLNYQTKMNFELEEENKGVVIGDGIASDKLLCVPREILCKNNGTLNFRKSLFQIENSKKYTAQQELEKGIKEWKSQEMEINENIGRVEVESFMEEEEQQIKRRQSVYKEKQEAEQKKNHQKCKLEELEAKQQMEMKDHLEEYENSKGEELTYGQEIQLRHIYSKCILTLRKEELAEQNGCVKVTLETLGGEGSNFKFIPANNLQIQGQTIQYTDKVILSSSGEKDDLCYLHIADDYGGVQVAANTRKPSHKHLFQKGLEVNASEVPTKFKVNCYVNHLQVKQQALLQDKYLQNGDLVYLFSKELEGNLAVQYQALDKYQTDITMTVQDGSGLSYESHMKSVDQEQMMQSQMAMTIYVEQTPKKQQVNCLWEIQQKETFTGTMGKDTDSFKMKNLSTGLFLTANQQGLRLTIDGKRPECLFKFKLKKQYSLQDQYVPLQESLNIKTYQGEFISIFVNKKDTFQNLMANYQQLKDVSAMHHRDYSQMKVTVSPKTLHHNSLLFELTRVESDLKVIADRICSLHPQLTSFLFFLQTYGIKKDKQAKLHYDYKTALAMERDLETELQQLHQSLQNLFDFLDPSKADNQDKSFKLKQYSLKDMQILDLLIQIAQTIDSLIDPSTTNYNEGIKAHMRRLNQSQQLVIQDNTPQYLASLHLNSGTQSVLKQIYLIIRKMVKNNRKNSEYLLQGQFIHFLLSQVKSDPTVESILLEAVYMASDCEQLRLVEWMDLVEPLPMISLDSYYPLKPRQIHQISHDQAAHQIHQDQLFALQIITYSLLDCQRRPIKTHQDQVRKYLSKQSALQGPLMQFHLLYNKPAVVFILDTNYNGHDFFKLNKPLEKLQQPNGTVILPLEQLSNKQTYKTYVKYIAAYLNLLADLCLGRNTKSIQLVINSSLSSQFLILSLQIPFLSSLIKHALTKLLLNVYLDLNPLTLLSNFDNRNVIYEDIPAIHSDNPSYQLIGQKFFINLQEHQKKLIQDFNQCKPYFLEQCWHQKFEDVDFQDIIDGQYDYEVQNELIIENIKAFIGLLQFTKQIIDLGFTNQKENLIILKKIKTLMKFQTCLSSADNPQSKKLKKVKKDWVSNFLQQLQKLLISKKYSQQNSDISEVQYLVSVIYEESIEILKVISRIKLINQYYEFLKIMYKNEIKGDMKKMFKSLKKVYKKDNGMYQNIFKMLIDPKIYQQDDSKSLIITPRLSRNIFNAINKFCDQNNNLAKEILNIVLINNDAEIQFYKQFGGFAVDESLDEDIVLNPMLVKSLINKLKWENVRWKQCQDNNQNINNQKYQKQEEKRLQTIKTLNDILIESIKKIKKIFDHKLLFKTAQEILRNLDIQNIVVQIIEIEHYEQKAYRQLFINVIKFLYLFGLDNSKNQEELLKNFYSLIKLVFNNISVKKLLASMLEKVKESRKSGEYIEDIMQLLSWNAIIGNQYNCNQFLSILLSLTRDRHKRPLRHNQQRILTKLLKIQQLMTFKEYQDSVEFMAESSRAIVTAKERLGFQNYEQYLQKDNYDYCSLIRTMNRIKGSELFNQLETHLNTIGLIANCADGYSLGIQSVRKIISKEQLNSYLVSEEASFKCKKQYLRLYYEVIMKQLDGLTHVNEFQLSDMSVLFQQVVLPDLEVFIQYLDGVIPIELQEPAKVEHAVKMRNKIKDNKNSFGLQLVKSKKQIQVANSNIKIIYDQKEYWDYLSGGDIFDNTNDGLLHFIFDCLQEMKTRDYWTQVKRDHALIKLFRALRDIVQNITNSLKRIEKECNQKFQKMNLLLKSILKTLEEQGDHSESRKEIEDEHFIEQEEKEESQGEDPVLNVIRLFIIRSRLSTEQFCRNFHYSHNIISVDKYLADLREVITSFDPSIIITQQQMNQHLKNLEVSFEQQGRQLIFLTALKLSLKNHLELNTIGQQSGELVRPIKALMMRAQEECQEETKINEIDLRLEKYKLMLLEYHTFQSYKDKNINLLTNVLNDLPSLKIKCQHLRHFMALFAKHPHILYLLRIIRKALHHDLTNIDVIHSDAHTNNTHNTGDSLGQGLIQNQYHRSGTTRLALGMVKQGNEEKIVYESIQILNQLLDGGNGLIQEEILIFFKNNEHNVQFDLFNYLKSHINGFKMLIQNGKLRKGPGQQLRRIAISDPFKFYHQRDKVGSQIIIKHVLLFLQLLCENCNNNLQNYLGNQNQQGQEVDNLANINIVQETADLLSSMKYNFSVQKTFFTKNLIEKEQFIEFEPDKGIVIFMESESELKIEFNDILNQCFKTLTDFCVGPCNKNQDYLCSDKKLIFYINQNILQQSATHSRKFELEKFQNSVNRSDIEVLSSCVKYLLIITIGNSNPENMQQIISHLKIKLMIENMHQIYWQTIKVRENHIISEKEDFLLQYVQGSLDKRDELKKYLTDIIQLGFDLYIIFQFFMDISNDPVFEYIKCDQSKLYNQQQKLEKKQHRDRETQLMETHFLNLRQQHQEEEDNRDADLDDRHKKKEDNNHYQREEIDQKIKIENEKYQKFKSKMKDHENYTSSCQFYQQFVGSVEIAKENPSEGDKQLFKLYFQKEFTSKFITKHIQNNIIYEVNRQSDQERISHFLKNIDNYKKEMLYRQKISKFNPILNFFVHSWRFFKDVSFFLVLVINILLICTIEKNEKTKQLEKNDNSNLINIYMVVTLIQMMLSVTVYVFCMVERLRISLGRSLLDNIQIDLRYKQQQKYTRNLNSLSLMTRFKLWYSNDNSDPLQPQSILLQSLKIIFDSQNLQNLLYLTTTFLAWKDQLFYSILLLDVVRRSEDLQNILKSLRMNYSSLGKTFFLGLVVIYLFSVFGFLSLKNYYVEGDNGFNYADKLYLAFTSTINNGLRAGGGIGDSLTQVTRKTDDYWKMWFFQLFFFLIVNLLLINIMFGIIIDTYGELREKTKEYLTEVKEKCYICGLSNQEFDNQGNGWLQHIYLEHNLYNYLHFIIYIKHKESQDCNGLEKYVKDQIMNEHHSFIPILQALSLNK